MLLHFFNSAGTDICPTPLFSVATEAYPSGASLGLGLWLGLEEVFVFDSKSENRDRAVEVVGGRVRVRYECQ